MEKTKKEQSNRMSDAPVGKLMLKMGIPMILSMMLQALYNIVDSAFVSNMEEGGEQALNALTLAFPMQMLMVAIGVGTGVGVNALASRTLGMKDEKKAKRVAGNGVFLAIVIYIVLLLFGIFGAGLYIRSQSDNAVIVEQATSYLKICMIVSPGIIFYSIFEKLLQATGLSLYSTIGQVAGAVINIVLDPIMIYGLLGLPEMGVQGAAYATVIGQIASAVLCLVFHLVKNKDLKFSFADIKPDGKIIREIYTIGLPAIVAQALMSIMTYGLNIILVHVSEDMVTAYGLYYKIQQFLLFAAFGLRDAITPITAFAYGMNNRKRINSSIKYGTLFTLVIMLVGTLVVELFAKPISGVFGISGNTEDLFVSAMHLISISFVFAGINIAFQGVFQALQGGTETLVVSLCRQLIFILPVAYVFTLLAKSNADLCWTVWLTFPIGEAVTAVISAILLKVRMKKVDAVIKEAD